MRKLKPFEYEAIGRVIDLFVSSDKSLGNEKTNLIVWMIRYQQNGLIGKDIKDIATRSNIGLSTVHGVLSFMREKNYLFKSRNGYFLENRLLQEVYDIEKES